MATTLPRRIFLGARLAGDDATAFGDGGLRIAGVIDGGVAAAAGLAAGDVLLAIDGAPVRTIAELTAALRTPAETITLATSSGTRTAPRIEAPRDDGASYGELAVPGARLRTITLRAADAALRSPAEPGLAGINGAGDVTILVLPGIACVSVEHGPLAALARAWAGAGFRVLRFDRRGVGDSEGAPCGEVDLATEIADQRAALATLPRPVVLFGHSVGGMTAALLGGDADGVIVFGTSPVRWLDCVIASQRRQGGRGDGLRDKLLREGGSGRSPAYHAQLDALDLPAAWRAVTAPVLVLHGEHDWVVGEDEARTIPGTFASLPGLDHLLGWHPDRASSIREYGNGRPDPAVAEVTIAWLRALRSRP